MNQKFSIELKFKDGNVLFEKVGYVAIGTETFRCGNRGCNEQFCQIDEIEFLKIDGEYAIELEEPKETLDRYVFRKEFDVHTGIFYLSMIDEDNCFPFVLVANKDDIGLSFGELDEKYGIQTRDFDVARLEQIEIYKGE